MELRSKSYTYTVSVDWKGEKKALATSEGKPDFEVATPPEFKGHPGIWSPEDLFVEAVNSCVMTTFLSFVERAGLELASYGSLAVGKLERGAEGFSFTEIRVIPAIGLTKEEDRAKALELIGKAEANCLVSNSIKAKVCIEPRIVVGQQGKPDPA